jgi:hypothetical protein
MNIKAVHIARLKQNTPLRIKSIYIYKDRRYRNGVKIIIEPMLPESAVSITIEGDEMVMECRWPVIFLGHIVLTKGVVVRRALASLVRRYRSRRMKRRSKKV